MCVYREIISRKVNIQSILSLSPFSLVQYIGSKDGGRKAILHPESIF